MGSILDELAKFEAEIANVESSVAQEPSTVASASTTQSTTHSTSNKASSSVVVGKPISAPPQRSSQQNKVSATVISAPPQRAQKEAYSVSQPSYAVAGPPLPPTPAPQTLAYDPTAAASYSRPQPPADVKDTKQKGGAEDTKHKRQVDRTLRIAGGQVWRDHTLEQWPDNDYRLFVGDLGNEVHDEALAKAFSHYPSFAMARVVRSMKTDKSKGFGFVSFLDPFDAVRAMREMNGKYIGNRPCKIKKSRWQERNLARDKAARQEQKLLVQLNRAAKK